MTLLGGPAASLLLVAGLLFLWFGGLHFQSEFSADSVIEFFLSSELSINLFKMTPMITNNVEPPVTEILLLMNTTRVKPDSINFDSKSIAVQTVSNF